MTLEERVREIQERIGQCFADCVGDHFDEVVAMVRAAVEAEREACAKVAEQYIDQTHWAVIRMRCEAIAAAIRARGNP